MAEKPDAAQGTPDAAAAAKAAADAASAAAAAAGKTESKPAGGQPGGGSTDGSATPKPKAPDTYALKIPEGASTYVDAADVNAIAVVAKANDWTNEEAQQYLDDQAADIAERAAAFRTQTEKDPEYGGTHLEESERLVKLVVDRVRPTGHARAESFRRILSKTGTGNHIELFSFLADLGKLMQEDRPAGGTSAGQKDTRSIADRLYDHGTKP